MMPVIDIEPMDWRQQCSYNFLFTKHPTTTHSPLAS
jgi:hypothetical protein